MQTMMMVMQVRSMKKLKIWSNYMAKSWLQNRYKFLNGSYDHRLLKKLAQFENDRQWQDVFNRLVSNVVNQYKWEGDIPNTIDLYFFEEQLLFRGMACWIKVSNDIFWGLPCIPTGAQNIYYDHNVYRAISLGFREDFRAITHYNKDAFDIIQQFGAEQSAKYDGCVCFDNYQHYPMIETVCIYTDKIVDTMRTLDVLGKQLKYSSIIETDEDSKLAMQTALRDIDQNLIAIVATNAITTKLRESKQINLGTAPNALISAWNHLTSLWSEFNTAFGINNMNRTEKRERLLVDEVNANNQEIQMNAQYRLDQRLHFCENLKSAFGIDVTCSERHPANISNSEELADGRIHGNFEGNSGNIDTATN